MTLAVSLVVHRLGGNMGALSLVFCASFGLVLSRVSVLCIIGIQNIFQSPMVLYRH